MARAQFYKGQKVWVETVGVWVHIEQIKPVWAKGFEEPVRITYDVGLGRDFLGHELQVPVEDTSSGSLEGWRVLRARNKWQDTADCQHHPHPGTYPVVVTDAQDWGGWRVPGAEYDRDPDRMEFQARLIAAAPQLFDLAREFLEIASDNTEDSPPEMVRLGLNARKVLAQIVELKVSPDASSEDGLTAQVAET